MKRLKQIIRSMDIFAHNQFLRYKRQQRYKTITGGIASFCIIVVCAAIFLVLIKQTFQRSVVISSNFEHFQATPKPFTLSISPQNKFMMAFGISGFDMRDSHYTYEIQKGDSLAYIPLIPCTKQHWTGITPHIDKLFQSFRFEHLLCAPIDTKLDFEGRYSSLVEKYSMIRISRCSNDSYLFPNTSCASEEDLQSYNGDFKAMLYYVNVNINSGKKDDYISYYLEDKYRFNFNLNLATATQLYFSQYSINTDKSLLPWEQNTLETGLFVDRINSNPIIQRRTLNSIYNPYFQIKLSKADFRLDCQRSYQKINSALSIIGGLFGAFQIGLLIFNNFNKYCYQIQFGDRVFKQNNKKSYGAQNFNFVVYLGYKIFSFLLKIGINLNWKSMKRYLECQQQTIKQLDINLIFKKLSYLQEALFVTAEQHHLKGLHLLPKPSINKVKERRRSFAYKSIMYQQLDRKAQQIHIEQEDMRKGTFNLISKDFFASMIQESKIKVQEKDLYMKKIIENYHELNQKAQKGDLICQKIMKNILQNMKTQSGEDRPLNLLQKQKQSSTKINIQPQEFFITLKTIQSSKNLNNNL